MNRSVRLTWWGLIAIMLCIVLAVSLLGKITGGFTKDWEDVTIMERNPDNLLSGKYGWTDDKYNSGDGITLNARKDGTVILNGEYKGSSEKVEITLEKRTLSAGTYTLSGAPYGGNYTYHLAVIYGSVTVIGDFGEAKGTFTLTESTEVTLKLVCFPDEKFSGVTIRPVLVEASEAGDFYKK